MEDIIETLAGSYVVIPIECVRPFKGQPRTFFDKDKLYRLSLSIKKKGQKHPVIVKRVDDEEGIDYEIIDGERRWRACQIGKIPTINAIVQTVSNEEEQFEISAISNFGREGHTPMEVAEAIQRLRKNPQNTIESIAESFSMSRGWVYQHLSFMQLDPRVQAMMSPDLPEDKQLKVSIATILAKVPSKEHQFKYASHIVHECLNLLEARHYLDKISYVDQLPITKNPHDRHDDFRVLDRFFGGLTLRSEMVMNLRQKNFEDILFNKDVLVIGALLDEINEGLGYINMIRKNVKDVFDRKKALIKDRELKKVS